MGPVYPGCRTSIYAVPQTCLLQGQCWGLSDDWETILEDSLTGSKGRRFGLINISAAQAAIQGAIARGRLPETRSPASQPINEPINLHGFTGLRGVHHHIASAIRHPFIHLRLAYSAAITLTALSRVVLLIVPIIPTRRPDQSVECLPVRLRLPRLEIAPPAALKRVPKVETVASRGRHRKDKGRWFRAKSFPKSPRRVSVPKRSEDDGLMKSCRAIARNEGFSAAPRDESLLASH